MPGRSIRRFVMRGYRHKKTMAILAVIAVVIGVTTTGLVRRATAPAAANPAQASWTAAGRLPALSRPAVGRVLPGQVPHRSAPGARGKGRPGAQTAPGSRPLLPRRLWPRGTVPPATAPAKPRTKVGRASQKLHLLASPPERPVRGFSPRTSKLLPGQDTADELVYANADGTRTAMIYQSPVNYQLPDGKWAPVNTKLVNSGPGQASPAKAPGAGTSASGRWEVTSAPLHVSFAPFADAPQLVRIPLPGGRSIAFGVAGVRHSTGTASGSEVSYPQVRADTELQYLALGGGIREQLVLKSRSAPATWTFPLALAGVTAKSGPGGTIDFAVASGKVLAVAPGGFMTDSNVSPRTGDGVYSTGVHLALVTAGGRQAIRMTLDKGWLASPARIFPVTVDPSITVKSVNSNGTTYVRSDEAGDFSTDTELHVGDPATPAHSERSYIKFDNVHADLPNVNVLGAELGLFETWSWSCQPRPFYIYPVTSSWTVTGSKTWPGPSIGNAIGHASFAGGWTPLGASAPSCPRQWHDIPLNQNGTNLVYGWTHQTSANNGLALGASATDNFGWKKFTSDTNPSTPAGQDPPGDPFLAVTYTSDGASYKLASTRPDTQVTSVQNGLIPITVTNTGSSTWTPASGYKMSYIAYDSKGNVVASAPVFTSMPSTVAPNGTAKVDVQVNKLPEGSYTLEFGMYSGAPSNPVAFSTQFVPPMSVGLVVSDPAPIVTGIYPPSGTITQTVTPQLSAAAYIPAGGGTPEYQFTIFCDPIPATVCPPTVLSSGAPSAKPYWTPSPPLQWNEPYSWSVTVTDGSSPPVTLGPVTITPEVPQPDVTSQIGGAGAGGQAFDPQIGDFTTSATDAAVAEAGPPLDLHRVYDSLNPVRTGAFGTGWSSVVDMQVTPDGGSSSDVVVTMPDGSLARFGNGGANGSGGTAYIPPFGSPYELTGNASGTWTMLDPSGNIYNFGTAGNLTKITDAAGLSQVFTNNAAGEVTSITDTASGRSLTLTWGQPSGTTNQHVMSVAISPPDAGNPWTYTYSVNKLTQVCSPAGGCTTYTYGATLGHLATSVMDAGPRTYYRLGDASGATKATDQVDTNLATTDGTYHNVTLGSATGPPGSSVSAAQFTTASSSYVSLAPNLVADSTYVSIGLWFNAAAGSNGVLFSYQGGAIGTSPTSYTPALYVGTDGLLRGELWNGSDDPITTTTRVDDGNWHYVVLAGAGNTQTLYLDGARIGSMPGTIDQLSQSFDSVGAGRWAGSNWPAHTTATTGYFTGDISDVAIYPYTLGRPAVAEQDAIGTGTFPTLTQVTLPSSSIYQAVSYDSAADRVADYTDPNGGDWQLGVPETTGIKPDSESLGVVTRSVTVLAPDGYHQVYDYDALNGSRLISFDRGHSYPPRTYGYNQAGYLDSVTDEDGNLAGGGQPTDFFTTDALGNVLSRSYDQGDNTNTSTTYYTYFESASNLVDPRNGEVTAIRDGRSSSSTDNTYLTSYTYNTAGQLTSVTTPPTTGFASGRTTSYAYSTGTQTAIGGGTVPAGLLLSATTPGGAVTGYAYFSDGDLAQVTMPSGLRTAYTYDGVGRAASATQFSDSYPAGLETTYTYTPLNELASVTDPAVTNTVTGTIHTRSDAYTYDADGNLVQLQQSDETGGDATRTTTWTYDNHGRVASVTDPAGDATGYNYDTSGQVTSKINADGAEYDYAYNPYGEVTSVTLVSPSTDQSNPGGGTSDVLATYSYDASGLLSAAEDAMDRITTYTYDGGQQLVKVLTTDPTTNLGREASYTYDLAGNLTSSFDAGLSGGLAGPGTQTSYTLNADNQLTSSTIDPTALDRTTSYAYDADGRVSARTVSDSAGSTVTDFGYNPAGNLTSRTVKDGSSNLETTWTYDERGLPLTRISPLGNVTGGTPASFTTSYGYNPAGNLTSLTGPPMPTQTDTAQTPVTTRPVTTYGYDSYGDQTAIMDPNGGITTGTYDGAGRVTALTEPSYTPPGAATAITATSTYAYDGMGNLTSSTDPAGNTTSFTYDALGDLTSRTDPQLTGQSAPGTWTWTYDAAGEPQTQTDPTGAQTQTTWDYFGDQATSTQDIRTSAGTTASTTSYAYNYLGEVARVTSPDGVSTQRGYNAAGELTSVTDAASDTSSYTYNRLGEISTATAPDQTSTSYAYDPAGNLTGLSELSAPPSPAVLSSQSFGYDANGDLTSQTDGRGNTSTIAYNAAGLPTSQTTPLTATTSTTTSVGYDPAGHQTAFTNGDGKTTWTTYNSWNLPESVIEPVTPTAPSGSTWTTAYNADGEPAIVTQPGGITQSNAYNQFGEVSQESGAGASATSPTQNFGYDLDGRLTSATAPAGTDTFTWNDASELTATAGPSGTASFTYNGDGLVTKRVDAAGTTSYGYDQADRLGTLADPTTGATASFGYNADSEPTSISYATSAGAGPVQTMAYNGLHELTGDTLKAASGTTIASQTWGYDPDGNLTSQTTTGMAGAGSTTYGYDQANWLTSATSGTTTTNFSYDNAGNLTQDGAVSFSYNAASQLTNSTSSAGSTSYAYTAAGALSAITPPAVSATSLTTNAYGQTASATAGGVTTSYGYDGLGRLTTRTTGTTTTPMTYSGPGNTLASDGATTYSYAPDGLPMGEKTGTSGQSVLTDLHDDLVATFPPTTTASALTASVSYTAYGSAAAQTGTMPAVGYQDGYTDPATGDVDMAARWYSPATGTFTSNDAIAGMPAAPGVSPSPYGYASSDPLTNVDPSGHCDAEDCSEDGVGGGDAGNGYYEDEHGGGEGNADPQQMEQEEEEQQAAAEGDAEASAEAEFEEEVRAEEEESAYSEFEEGYSDWYNEQMASWNQWADEMWEEISAPLPPPPPPQDIYEGADAAEAPTAPRALRATEHITSPGEGTESGDPAKGTERIINEPVEQAKANVRSATVGTEGVVETEGSAGTAPATSTALADDPAPEIGEAGVPEPSSSEGEVSEAEPSEAGSDAPEAQVPEPEPPAPDPTSESSAPTETEGTADEGRIELSRPVKSLLGGAANAIGNVLSDLITHKNGKRIAVDAGIGLVTGGLGGFAGSLGAPGSASGVITAVGGGALGNTLNSFGTQVDDNGGHLSQVDGLTIITQGLLGGFYSYLGGAPGAVGIAQGNDLFESVFSGLLNVGGSVCNPSNLVGSPAEPLCGPGNTPTPIAPVFTKIRR